MVSNQSPAPKTQRRRHAVFAEPCWNPPESSHPGREGKCPPRSRSPATQPLPGTAWDSTGLLYKLLKAGLVEVQNEPAPRPPKEDAADAGLLATIEAYNRAFLLLRDVLRAKAVEVDLGRVFEVFLRSPGEPPPTAAAGSSFKLWTNEPASRPSPSATSSPPPKPASSSPTSKRSSGRRIDKFSLAPSTGGGTLCQ